MKKFVLALAAAAGLMSSASYASTCYTNCYWIGDQQYCTTTCNEY